MDEELATNTTSEAAQTTPETEVKASAPEATEVKAKEAQGEQKLEAKDGKAEGNKAPETITKEQLDAALAEAKATVKGGYEGTVNKLKDDLSKLQQAHNTVLAQIEEARQTEFLKSVEANGGDVNAARLVVERERKISQRESQLNSLAEQLAATKAELDQAAIGKTLNDVITQYGLGADEAKELSKAKNAVEIELQAAKIALAKAKAEKKATTKVAGDDVGGSPVDFSKLSDMEKLTFALQHKN